MGNKSMKNKDVIRDMVRRVIISINMGVREGEFSEEEICKFINEYGAEQYEKFKGMSDKQFALEMVKELLSLEASINE